MKAEQIKRTRQNLGLTQKQFAEKLKTTVTTVSNWENSRTSPYPSVVVAILKLRR